MIKNIKNIVDQYYGNTLFLFLPNRCNARCYFCYLKPSFRSCVTLSKTILQDLKKVLLLFRTLNFMEVRITGGEPLVISDLKYIIEIVKTMDMNFTLLTNGVLLEKNIDWILDYSPSKLTISFHSFSNYSQIYGIKENPYNILQIVEKLLSKNINIAISITFLPENKSEIINIVNDFYKIGVNEFKIIYPNYKLLGTSLYIEWLTILQKLKSYKENERLLIRVTNFCSKSCELIKRGFLSLTIPRFNLFGCCALVKHENFAFNIQDIDTTNLINVLFKCFTSFTSTLNYPCISHINTCPLSLESL